MPHMRDSDWGRGVTSRYSTAQKTVIMQPRHCAQRLSRVANPGRLPRMPGTIGKSRTMVPPLLTIPPPNIDCSPFPSLPEPRLADALASILNSYQPTTHPTEFMFDCTLLAAAHNLAELRQYSIDLGVAMAAQPFSAMTPGSEFRPSACLLAPLFSRPTPSGHVSRSAFWKGPSSHLRRRLPRQECSRQPRPWQPQIGPRPQDKVDRYAHRRRREAGAGSYRTATKRGHPRNKRLRSSASGNGCTSIHRQKRACN